MAKRKKTIKFTQFENSLFALKEESEKGSVSLKKIITQLSGRGKTLLLIFLCLPFGQILGFAFFFGLLISFLGFRMAFSKHSLWLPASFLRKKINGKILKKIIKHILSPLKKIKPLTHPRYGIYWNNKTSKIINGSVIGLVGFFLAISMPIPFSSLIACLTIFLLGLGILNDDGALIFIAYPLALFYMVFVILTLEFISLEEIYLWVKAHM